MTDVPINNKREEIRKKCIEANPSIIALEFGCLLHRTHEGKDYGYYQILEQGSGFHPEMLWVSSRVFGKIHIDKNETGTEEELSIKDITDKFEILGRPIRLADVLLALSQVGAVTRGGKYLINIVTDGNSHIDYRWNLLKDNIADQSPETIDFLYNLLK